MSDNSRPHIVPSMAIILYLTIIPVKDRDTEKFRKYYGPLNEGPTIDIYGMANEPGSTAAMDMIPRTRWRNSCWTR